MEKKKINVIIAIGAFWGLLEAGLGMYLRGSCARFLSGSIMVGVAVFFSALTFSYSKSLLSLLIIAFVSSWFKLFDAYLLGKPIFDGAIINPIFGIITEVLSFILVLSLINNQLRNKIYGRMILGVFSALLSAIVFPFVKYFTNIPACVLPGTKLPLSLWGAPVAIAISCIACPLGFLIGESLSFSILKYQIKAPRIVFASSYALTVICILALYLLRI